MLVRWGLSCVVAVAFMVVGAVPANSAIMLEATAPVALNGDLYSTQISLVGSEGEVISGLGNVSVTGSVHQVGIPNAFGGDPNPTVGVDDHGTQGFREEWAAYDTYIKVGDDSKVGSVGAEVIESNDLSTEGTLGLPLFNDTFEAPSGFGGLASSDGSDAFGLVPAAQSSSIDLLQVVGPLGTAFVNVSYSLDDGSEGRIEEFEVLGGEVGDDPTVEDLHLVANDLNEVVSGVVDLTDVDSLSFDDIGNPDYTPDFGAEVDAPGFSGILPTLNNDGEFEWNTNGSTRGTYSWAITGTNAVGSDGGFISVDVTQVPEPATLALFGLTVVGLVGAVRRVRVRS